MIPQSNVLVISNGNDGQIPFLIQLFRSLYNPNKGAFKGDFQFYSDHLTKESQEQLSKAKVPFTILQPETVATWKNLLHSQKHALGKVAKPLFIKYAIQEFGERYTTLVYIDPDILIQKPLMDVLKPLEEIKKGVFYSAQLNSTMNIRWPKMQLERTFNNGHLLPEDLNEFTPEINTGFMFGDIPSISSFMEGLLSFMTSEPFNLYANEDEGAEIPNDWHDQDFFRVYARLGENDKKFSIIPEGFVYHLCNDVYKEFELIPFSTTLKRKSTGEIPSLVHFAGGVWINYLRLSSYFLGVNGIQAYCKNILRKPLRLFRNKVKKTYHQCRRWLIPEYRKVKYAIRRLLGL